MIRKHLFFTAAAFLALTSCTSAKQRLINKMSSQLQVYYKVNDNQAGRHGIDGSALGAQDAAVFTASIFLQNSGSKLYSSDWAIYFSSIRRILRTDNDQFTIRHITGDLHELRPTEKFAGFPSGDQIEIPIVGEFWQLFETDISPRWYLAAQGAKPRIIRNTDTENLQNFVYPIEDDLYQNSLKDMNVLMTPQARFRKNSEIQLLPTQDLRGRIIPTPLSSEIFPEDINLSSGISFDNSSLDEESLNIIKNRLQLFGIKVNMNSRGYHIKIQMIPEIFDSGMQISGAYQLRIDPENAEIIGYDEAGLFYGLQSLLSLIKIGEQSIPSVAVYDAPRFSHRAMHLDIARNFHSKESIYRLLDQMAAYKLNKFHLHLSDDEGWRLEIPDLPELTDVASQRSFDLKEKKTLLTQLGSGPFTNNSGSGYLSRQDYIDILKYAKMRYILVIPEIAMPAHARAAVTAMEVRYHNFMKKGKKEQAEEYRLIDPEDTSNVTTVQYYDHHSFINPALDSSRHFMEKVVSEIAQMHKEADNPLSIWHYGGDEAKNIFLGNGFQNIHTQYKSLALGTIDQDNEDEPFAKSPAARRLLEQGIISDYSQLSSYFAIEVSRILAKYGIVKMMAWQDGVKDLSDASELSVSEAGVNLWDTVFGGAWKSAPFWATKNFSVIISSPDFLYFNMPYEMHPAERGYYWATRFSDERKIFSFAPNNLPQNAETSVDLDGQPYTARATEKWPGAYGLQGQLWSEIVRTDEQMEYMIYPRLIALAERAWHQASWELEYIPGREYSGGRTHYVNQDLLLQDWEYFANVLGQKELPKLDKHALQYRISTPGARIKDGMLEMNVALPGLRMEYSIDEGISWKEYTQPVPVATDVFFRAVATDGRSSRIELVKR